MYVSPNNPGALRAALKVQRGMPQLQLTVRPPAPVRDALGAASDLGVDEPEPTVFLLYLNDQTYLGEEGERLAAELQAARKDEFQYLMLHENDPAHGGCEFAVFFDGRTPTELLAGGIYKALALALYPGPFLPVSVALAATTLGATDEGSAWARLVTKVRGKVVPKALNDYVTELEPSRSPAPVAVDALALTNQLHAQDQCEKMGSRRRSSNSRRGSAWGGVAGLSRRKSSMGIGVGGTSADTLAAPPSFDAVAAAAMRSAAFGAAGPSSQQRALPELWETSGVEPAGASAGAPADAQSPRVASAPPVLADAPPVQPRKWANLKRATQLVGSPPSRLAIRHDESEASRTTGPNFGSMTRI